MGKQRQYRKRKVQEDDAEDTHENSAGEGAVAGAAEGEQVDLRTQLEATKMLQQRRVRSKGFDASSLAQGAPPPAAADGDEEPEEEEHDKEEEGLGGFQARADAEEDAEEDPRMLKYVEQEIAKKLGKRADDRDDAAAAAAEEEDHLEAEDSLYKTPSYLKVRRLCPESEV